MTSLVRSLHFCWLGRSWSQSLQGHCQQKSLLHQQKLQSQQITQTFSPANRNQVAKLQENSLVVQSIFHTRVTALEAKKS